MHKALRRFKSSFKPALTCIALTLLLWLLINSALSFIGTRSFNLTVQGRPRPSEATGSAGGRGEQAPEELPFLNASVIDLREEVEA